MKLAAIRTVLFVLAVLCAAAPAARADDPVAVTEKEVSRGLLDIARELARLDEARDETPLQRIRALLQKTESKRAELERKIDENKNVLGAVAYKAKDKTVREYQKHIDNFERLAPALSTLKKAQFALDKIPDSCTAEEKAQNDLIAKYIRDKNTEGIEELPKKYRDVGRRTGLSVEQADAMEGKLKKAFDDVKGFDPAGADWDAVEKAMEESAQKIFAYWAGALRDIHKQCDELAKGEKDADVVKGLAVLEGIEDARLSAAEKLLKSARKWRDSVRDVIRVDCESMEKIWFAYCGTDWEPKETFDRAEADKVAADMKRGIVSRIGGVKDAGMKIRGEMGKITRDDQSEKPLDKTKEILEKYEKQIKNVLEEKASTAKDAELVMFQFSSGFGMEQHNRMERAYGCDTANVEYKSGQGRPDCVRYKDCTIFEFKPNTPKEISKGKAQLHRYIADVQEFYEDEFKKLDAAKAEKAPYKGCLKDGKATFKGALGLYDMCKNTYTCGDWKSQ